VERDGVHCRLVRLVPSSKNTDEFVCLNWEAWRLLYQSVPTLDRLPEVYSCVINACRTCRNRTILFTRKWYGHLDIPSKTVRRCLDRLVCAGLLKQQKCRGRSPEVTLAAHVPLDLGSPKSRKCRRKPT
jgi:hypothetical protein